MSKIRGIAEEALLKYLTSWFVINNDNYSITYRRPSTELSCNTSSELHGVQFHNMFYLLIFKTVKKSFHHLQTSPLPSSYLGVIRTLITPMHMM